MNSLGLGITANQRVANLPLVVEDSYNPRNQTAVLNSFKARPQVSQISNYGMNIYRDRMNDVDYDKDFKDEVLRKNVISIANARRKNLLRNYQQAPMFPVPNDRNNSTGASVMA